MKILIKGKVPKIKLKGTCGGCHCVISCLVGEVIFVEDRGQDHATYKCPTPGCNSTIYLNWDECKNT